MNFRNWLVSHLTIASLLLVWCHQQLLQISHSLSSLSKNLSSQFVNNFQFFCLKDEAKSAISLQYKLDLLVEADTGAVDIH